MHIQRLSDRYTQQIVSRDINFYLITQVVYVKFLHAWMRIRILLDECRTSLGHCSHVWGTFNFIA